MSKFERIEFTVKIRIIINKKIINEICKEAIKA